MRLLPSIKSARNVDNMRESCTLQQAGGNDAAVSALAMHGQSSVAINLRRRHLEVVERPPDSVLNVRRIPFRLAPHIKYLQFAGLHAHVQLLRCDLRNGREGQARL